MREFFITKSMEADPRESKLPAWARDKLETMRRATSDAVSELAMLKSGTKPSEFWLEGWDDGAKFYLPRDAGRLMFRSGNGTLQLSAETGGREDGWLNISGGTEGLVAAPSCANVLLVRNQRVD